MHSHTRPAGHLASLPAFPPFQCPWQRLVCGYLHLVPKTFMFKTLLSFSLPAVYRLPLGLVPSL